MKAFELKDISYSYLNRQKALEGISFEIKEGESLSIIGSNGTGKSTLLYIMDGIIKPTSGRLAVFETPIEKEFPYSLRQRISLLFQNSHAQLFSLSVWDELLFGPLQLGMSASEAAQRAESVLELLGIGDLRDRGPWDLSGGEMKKVALGTCLSINPDVLLLDEPTSGLDPRSQVEIIDLISSLRESGKTIITATHDLHIISDISDRTIVMAEDHRIALEGSPWEVLDDHETLLRANLIHSHIHRHCWYEHEHPHHGAHAHEHMTKIEKPLPEDINKLLILIEHWDEHNTEHSNTYLEWSKRAESMGRHELASLLREISEKTLRLSPLFMRAKRIIS